MTTTAKPVSRRHAMALAAALTATVVTAIAAVGGLNHWGAPRTPVSSAPVASVVQQAPAAPAGEVDD